MTKKEQQKEFYAIIGYSDGTTGITPHFLAANSECAEMEAEYYALPFGGGVKIKSIDIRLV